MHTPGPWKVYHAKLRPQFSTKIIEIQDDHGNAIVAWSGFDAVNRTVKKKMANARLMAAAPDMIEALNHAETVMMMVVPRSDIEEYRETLKLVTAAILKATGASK